MPDEILTEKRDLNGLYKNTNSNNISTAVRKFLNSLGNSILNVDSVHI